MTQNGHELQKEQKLCELERQISLESNIQKSLGGLSGSQTITVFDEKIIAQTQEGPALMNHLTWLESLGELSESQGEEN